AITKDDLANNAVIKEKIAFGAVNASHIISSSINSSHIASKAVGSDQINNYAVVKEKIAFGAVNASHISPNSINSSHIAQKAVGSDQINNGAVTNLKIRDSVGLSVIGRSANTPGQVADISASLPYQVLRVDPTGSYLEFGPIGLNSSSAVTGALGIAHGGTGATSADSARVNLNAVNKSGDVMTGSLRFEGSTIQIGTVNAQALQLITNSNPRIEIDRNGLISIKGRVGIGSDGIDDNTERLFIKSDSGEVPLNIKANNVNALYIDSIGKVGIGTTTPQQKLHVNGDAIFNSSIFIRSSPGNAPLRVLADTTEALYVDSTGKIGIGTTTPQYKLSLGSTDDDMGFYQDGDHYAKIRFYNSSNGALEFHVSNPSTGGFVFFDNSNVLVSINKSGNSYFSQDIYARAFYYTSDKVKKENITNISGALDMVKKMQGVGFNFKADESKSHKVGFIAQDMELILPEVVSGEEGSKTIDYASISAILVEAVKELDAVSLERYKKQQEEIEDLRREIELLKGKVNG
ncbi:MAG: tail fiber domain-containing protein, partial [Bacilli bacterium]